MNMALDAVSLSSASSQMAKATCPSGESVLGGGGWISDTGGQVGLQVARASASGSLFYAGSHEDASGYSGTYSTIAFAVCAPTPAGYAVVTTLSAASGSEDIKTAFADCPSGTQLLNAGGATSFTAPGEVSLTRTLVDPVTAGQAEAVATENTATSASWDSIAGQTICAT
jgi:hypothetical protein